MAYAGGEQGGAAHDYVIDVQRASTILKPAWPVSFGASSQELAAYVQLW